MGVRGIGATMAEAFAEGAQAMVAVMVDIQTVRAEEAVEVVCRADEPDLLFADWLNALIYEMEVRKMVFRRFEVVIEGMQLRGRARGEPFDPQRHAVAVGVKVATYMELKVHQRQDGQWIAQCVVDV